jgi:hypothetical protein
MQESLRGRILSIGQTTTESTDSVIFDEDTGKIAFTEYPAKPHHQIVDVIEVLFTAQFRVPYLGQGGPQSTWVGDGNTGTILSPDIRF